MSILSNNKLKLEVKSTEAEVAKFVSTQNQADVVLIPSADKSAQNIAFTSKADAQTSNIFQISATLHTDTAPLASFKYTNTDLTTTAIIKGDLIIDGSALSLGTVILNDENDNSFTNVMPQSPYSNLISERYTSLLHSNISATSNTISTTINTLYSKLDSNISNLFNIQRLFTGISFTSFSDTDFDTRLLTRTTDNLQNGTTNVFIINKTHPNNLVINTGLNASNLITKSVNATAIYANRFYADGSHLQNILLPNGIDGTTNTIPELPNASNLYYTSERVIPIINASNTTTSNYADITSNNLLNLNKISEESNTNLILETSNHLATAISTSISGLSNAISADNARFYNKIIASNLYVSNITESFGIDTQASIQSIYLNTSNYIWQSSNTLATTLHNNIRLLSASIHNLDATYQYDMQYTSNALINGIASDSNVIINNLYTADTDASNMMQNNSNYTQQLILDSSLNHSNNVSNVYYDLGINLQSNLLNTSNYATNVFIELADKLETDTSIHSAIITQTTNDLDALRQLKSSDLTAHTDTVYNSLSNLTYESFVIASNSLMQTSNKVYDNMHQLMNELLTVVIPESCNHVAITSNDIRNYIFANFMNQFSDISADITAISDSVNQRINGLTTETLPEGDTNTYLTCNLFKSKIQALTLDDIRQGTQMKYITNNVYEDSLTVSAQLSASNLIVSGTETMLMTNTLLTDELQIVSSAFNTALTVKQADANKNIMKIQVNNNNPALVATQNGIGIKTETPTYLLDVSGTLQASAFIASGAYLQNVNLSDKSTADLAEHSSRLYYTPERAGIIISYSNVLASNYAEATSNTLDMQRNNLMASTIAYADDVYASASDVITISDTAQSNYLATTSNTLRTYAYANLLNDNQSNYVKQSLQNLDAYLLVAGQSDYLRITSNNLSTKITNDHRNISNYVVSSCNINLGQQWHFSSNTSNYVRISSNALITHFMSLDIAQTRYSSNTSNTLWRMMPNFDLNMSNYVRATSNIMSTTRILNNLNNSNYIATTSNQLISYIRTTVANLQTNGSGTVSATATYINRWQEPTTYITNSVISSIPFNYVSYNDGTAVGIGITNPTATLEVYTADAQTNSVKVNNHIWAQTGIITSSDSRIKKDIKDIADEDALQQILAIEPKIYNYLDPRKQKQDVYGFIAQQVAEVIPNAVRLQSAYIPDILCKAMIYENVLMINEDVPIQLQENDKIGILHNSEEYALTIEDIYSENTYQVDNIYKLKGELFIYGRYVDNFHTLDKNYIYTLNVCATQDLHRRQQAMYNNLLGLKDTLGYTLLDACNQQADADINALAYIPEKINNMNITQERLQGQYIKMFDINRQLTGIANEQPYDIKGSLNELQIANEKLKADNMMLENNNSNLRNMMGTLSDRIAYIRGVLQRNNII